MLTSSATYFARHWTPPRIALPTSFARILSRLVGVVATEVRIRREMRELMALSDHLLKDIGLSRAEVAHATRFGRFE